MPRSYAQRIRSRCVREDECLVWQGARDAHGYGMIGTEHRTTSRVHRLIYAEEVGPVGNLHVLHRCDNPPCCEPTHLWLGTPLDNARDRAAKGRGRSNPPLGERVCTAKLTEFDVRTIRYMLVAGDPATKIAERFGVHRDTIGAIKRGEQWKHVK